MEANDQQQKMTFSTKGAWLGLAAYIVLILVITAIFLLG